MDNHKAPAAQARHAGALAEAIERKARNQAPAFHYTGTFEQVQAVTSLAEAINQLMGQHAQESARGRPEWLRDKDIRELYFGSCSRAHFWLLAKRPDFPKARQISPKIRVRNRFEIERWLAERPEVA